VKKAAGQQRDQRGLRVPVWQRLSGMDGPGHQDLQRKGSVWRRITPSQSTAGTESSTQPALMAASSGATAPALRSMRKRRRAKRRRGVVEQALLPLPPPSDHDAPLVMQEEAGSDESSVEPTCVLELSIGMAQEEVALRRALYVMVVGTRPKVLGAEVVEEVARCFGIDADSLAIHQAMPEDFLLFLPNEDTATRVFNEGKVFRGPRFNLQFKRWSRFTHATAGALPFLVDVQIWGIPAHAWARSTAEHLLHDSCLVSDIHPATALKSDLSSFKLRAWCFDPKKLHRNMKLYIAEPGMVTSEKRCLSYNISMAAIPVDASSRAEDSPPPPPPADGTHPDGDNERHRPDSPSRHPRKGTGQRRSIHLRLGPQQTEGCGWGDATLTNADPFMTGASGCDGLELYPETGPLDLAVHASPLHDNMSAGLFELNGPGSP
jgi:hypothetical protein